MTSVRLSLDRLVSLYRSAAVGRLVDGLIHNLNGPLQNLGMDMEMMAYRMHATDTGAEARAIEEIATRLGRMEEELERINHLVRNTAMRVDSQDDPLQRIKLNDWIQEEISFLKANLYFKHSVHTSLHLDERCDEEFPFYSDVLMALDWLFQEFTAELEQRELKTMDLRTVPNAPGVDILLASKEGGPSEGFLGELSLEVPASKSVALEADNIAPALAGLVLRSRGASLRVEGASAGSRLRIYLPPAA